MTEQPEGTAEALATCAAMLEQHGPELFPANEQGQVHFARVMMDSTAAEIRAFLSTDSPTPPTHIDPGTVERLRTLLAEEVLALRAMQATVGDGGADPKLLDEWIAVRGKLAANALNALPALLAALDRTTSDIAVRSEGRREGLEEAALVADKAAAKNERLEAEYLASSKAAKSATAREVDLDYAVSYGQRARNAEAIARTIRALKGE